MSGTVAIVDDDSSIRRAVQNLLASAGFEAVAYASAEDFLTRGDAVTPACVVLDLRMPGMQGLDLLMHLAATAPVPVVILTGHGDDDARRRALAAGASAFLTKPFRGDALLAAVCAALD